MDGLTRTSAGSGAVETSNAFFDRNLADQRVMAIIRGLPAAQTVEVCERAWQVGIEMVEVPLQDARAVASLRAASAAAAERNGRKVGAGTVTKLGRVEEASRLGVAFTVAPGLDENVVRASLQAGMAHLPGVATATEVQRAIASGMRWMKVFPAAQLTPGWIKALLAPFPDACFVATGGIDAYNASDFISVGARAVAVGSALNDPDQIPLLAALKQPPTGKGRTA